jgi:hypothetical protein
MLSSPAEGVMTASMIATLPALALAAGLAYGNPLDPAMHRGHRPHEKASVADVTTGAARYMELRRQLEGSLPPPAITSDAELRARLQHVLAVSIRDARAFAAQGDVFTPRAARYLRRWIEVEVRARGGMPALFGEGFATALPYASLAINQELPWGAGDIEWPIALMELPPVPRELAYRLWGRDLLLVDLDANIVVDVLEDALPPAEAPPALDDTCEPVAPPPVSGDPCDAHADLAMCWS